MNIVACEGHEHSMATLFGALDWLDCHVDELEEAPTRLHQQHGAGSVATRVTKPGRGLTGGHDGLGAPAFSHAFAALLDGSPFRTTQAQVEVVCPMPHPIRARAPKRSWVDLSESQQNAEGPARPAQSDACPMCNDQLAWTTTRTVYVAPLAAALERLSHVKSPAPTVPSPFVIVVALLDCGLDIDRMHERLWGRPISSEDRRATVEAMVISALRKLHGRWSSGPIPKRAWVDLSESQQRAQDAA